jgi:hypothetical protein
MHKRAIVTTAGFATSTHSPVVVVASSGLAITGNENPSQAYYGAKPADRAAWNPESGIHTEPWNQTHGK